MRRLTSTLAAGIALALVTVLAVADPASAATRYASLAIANDARHAVGDTWSETLPNGATMTVEKIAPGVSRSLTAVPNSAGQCSGYPYLCAWKTDSFSGTFWRYDMNNVYSNTVNGVAHCWNLAADANNNQKSWLNMSDRAATVNNWVNCNSSGEHFTFQKLDTTSDSYKYGGSCEDATQMLALPGQNWCTTQLATSIRASA